MSSRMKSSLKYRHRVSASSVAMSTLGAVAFWQPAANRTLTLLDNQRVVGALNIGVTDAGAFPQALVKRHAACARRLDHRRRHGKSAALGKQH